MVKKLFKHEIFSYLRTMSIVYGILLIISLFTRIMLVFESDATAYTIVMSFTWITYAIAILVAMGFVTVLSIVRFYKNLFTGEGYLSFTLPVTPTQHIWVKAITALLFHVITFVVTVISLCVIMSGDVLNEVFKAVAYIIGGLSEAPENLLMHLCLYLLEFIIVSLVAILQTTFVYYTFISIGQLFNKNRILAAIGAWFAHYILSQILSTILSIVLMVGIDESMYAKIGEFITEEPIAFFHIFFGVMLLIEVLFGAIYYIVTTLIIKKKLNLE